LPNGDENLVADSYEVKVNSTYNRVTHLLRTKREGEKIEFEGVKTAPIASYNVADIDIPADIKLSNCQ
jgi:hypothetical protein